MPNETKGRKNNQKMKPYLVYQYLLHNSDENNVVTANEIVEHIKEYGIDAERRGIYKDIEEINKAIWMLENYGTIEEVTEMIENDEFDDAEKTIVYDSHAKGFYVQHLTYTAFDIRLISECIYSSKYISQDEAERLIDIMKGFISDTQADEIRTDALVTDRVRTLNKSVINNVSSIYDAMSKKINGEKHIPEKISFQYMKYDFKNLNQQVERIAGVTYVVSPFKLIINDGNYYLIGYNDYNKAIRTYRVDRMKNLRRIGKAREGEEEFKKIELSTYTQRTFSMFHGTKEHVILQADISLLDTIVERFGRRNVSYSKASDKLFNVSIDLEISDQFYGWICGLGTKIKILAPATVRASFIDYLDEIKENY